MIYQNVAGEIHIANSTLTKTGYYNNEYDNIVYLRSGGLVTIDDSRLEGDCTVVVRLQSTSSDNYIKNSYIISNSHDGIYTPSSKLTIENSYVETKDRYHAVDPNTYSTITIKNCELRAANNYAVRSSTGVTLTIEDSEEKINSWLNSLILMECVLPVCVVMFK